MASAAAGLTWHVTWQGFSTSFMQACGSASGLAQQKIAANYRLGKHRMAGVFLRRAAGAARTIPSAWRSNVSLPVHRRP